MVRYLNQRIVEPGFQTEFFKTKKVFFRIQIMKKKTVLRLLIGFGLFIILFIIFEYFTWGGFWIYDLERWESYGHSTKEEGSFKPRLTFSGNSKQTTIIPLVLSKITSRPKDSIGIRKTDSNSPGYGYNLFEYVRFARFEVHYESGNVQKLLKDNSPIIKKIFKVFSPKIGMDLTSLFRFRLDRIEKCTVIIEGYAKLIEANEEEFFRSIQVWHIAKYKNIRTGRDRLASAATK